MEGAGAPWGEAEEGVELGGWWAGPCQQEDSAAPSVEAHPRPQSLIPPCPGRNLQHERPAHRRDLN